MTWRPSVILGFVVLSACAMTSFVQLPTRPPLPLIKANEARIVPQTQSEITLSFAPVVKQTAPAVVNIYTKKIVQRRASPFAGDPFFQQFFKDMFPGGGL